VTRFTSLRRRVRTAAIACTLALGLVTAVGASPASATTITWFNGGGSFINIAPGYPWGVGSAHSITDNSATVAYDACIGAIDVNGGQLSGAGICSTGWPWTTGVSHPYCGCVLRDPAVYPYGGSGGALFYGTESY
jgi:hypothetical protein